GLTLICTLSLHDALPSFVQLGHVAEQQGRQDEAIELYGRVDSASPLKRLSEMQLGLNLADIGRDEEAIAHLRALVEQDPDDMRRSEEHTSELQSRENLVC